MSDTKVQTGVGTLVHNVNSGGNKITVVANGSTFSIIGYSQPVGTANRVGDILVKSGSDDFNGTILAGYKTIEVIVSAYVGDVLSLIIPTYN